MDFLDVYYLIFSLHMERSHHVYSDKETKVRTIKDKPKDHHQDMAKEPQKSFFSLEDLQYLAATEV